MNLSDSEWGEFAALHPDWELVGESISRTFTFEDFTGSVAFIVRVGYLAEAANHHPDIDIRWNRVTLVLSTHEAGALTAMDTTLAAAIDRLI
jgi:4a-hydroxytetrahydrobiopterin dehydratase